MGKSKKSIIQSINSYLTLIEEHQDKITQALKTGKNIETIPHWEKEIQNFEILLEKEKHKLQK